MSLSDDELKFKQEIRKLFILHGTGNIHWSVVYRNIIITKELYLWGDWVDNYIIGYDYEDKPTKSALEVHYFRIKENIFD